jgi:hypothetical protein
MSGNPTSQELRPTFEAAKLRGKLRYTSEPHSHRARIYLLCRIIDIPFAIPHI